MPDNELYLNVPPGFPITQKIAKSDIGGLKSFLIGLSPDERTQDFIRTMTDEEVLANCETNNFTFDADWYGYRELQGSL